MAKSTGRVPKAPGTTRRRNKPTIPVIKGERRGRKVNNPKPKREWRKDVRDYFSAHFISGQSDFYEQSDVAALTIQCELLDRVLRDARTVVMYERDPLTGQDLLDDDGNKIPLLDEYGEPQRMVLGKVNGMALKSVLDMGQDLLTTEGARRRLRIDLAQPVSDEESPEEQLIAQQKATFASVAGA